MKREIVTVYLVLPADRLETHANYLRLIVTSALRALLRSLPSATLPPALFILDELAQLGYLPPIETAMGIARGFGVRCGRSSRTSTSSRRSIATAGRLSSAMPEFAHRIRAARSLHRQISRATCAGEKTEIDESIGYGDDGHGNLRITSIARQGAFRCSVPEELMGFVPPIT